MSVPRHSPSRAKPMENAVLQLTSELLTDPFRHVKEKTMKFNLRLLTLLLPLAMSAAQTADAEDSPKAVVWSLTISSKATSLEKAKEIHDGRLLELRDQQSQLKVAADDVFVGAPELRRVYYRYTPRGYQFRQAIYLRQRDTSRFDEFFEALASQDSLATRVSFAYRPVTWEPRIEANPTIAEWEVIIIGDGKTLVESKRSFESELTSLKELLEDYEVSSFKTGTPYMVTIPENVNPDEKPQGYTYHQKLTFRQTDLEHYEALLKKFAEIDSKHLNVQFVLGTEK
jgi:hypothetical protein